MRLLTVHHLTTYRYKQPVAFGEHRMMLRPRDSYDQRLIDTRLVITPEPIELRWVHDVFGNCVALARFSERADQLRFDSTIRLDHSVMNELEFGLEGFARHYPFSYGSEEQPGEAGVPARPDDGHRVLKRRHHAPATRRHSVPIRRQEQVGRCDM